MPNISPSHQLTACPACAEQSDYITRGSSDAFTQMAGVENFVQPPFEARECSLCGLVYKSAVLSKHEMDRYYASVDHSRWHTLNFHPTERIVIDILGKLDAGARVLDIGCSRGRLLAQFTNKFDCYGIEPNAEAASEAARVGVKILPESSLQADEMLGRFDAVIMMDVFEHLYNPLEVIFPATAILRDGGILIVGTGDADSKSFGHNLAGSWYMQNVEHVVMLTRRFAAHLESILPLSVIGWQKTSHYDSTIYSRMAEKYKHLAHTALKSIPTPTVQKVVAMALPRGRKLLAVRGPLPVRLPKDHAIVQFRKA